MCEHFGPTLSHRFMQQALHRTFLDVVPPVGRTCLCSSVCAALPPAAPLRCTVQLAAWVGGSGFWNLSLHTSGVSARDLSCSYAQCLCFNIIIIVCIYICIIVYIYIYYIYNCIYIYN